jgi:hypothetical protein
MGLAGKAATDELNGLSQSICRKVADVRMDWDARPVVAKDLPALGVELAEGDGSHPGSLEAEAESANAAE